MMDREPTIPRTDRIRRSCLAVDCRLVYSNFIAKILMIALVEYNQRVLFPSRLSLWLPLYRYDHRSATEPCAVANK